MTRSTRSSDKILMTISATQETPLVTPNTSNGKALHPLPRDEADLVIKPRKGWIGVDWRELIRYRELLFFLIWRDVKVKYKQAVLGFTWAIIVPVLQVIIFTAIGKAAGFASKVTTVLYLNSGQEIRGVVQQQDASSYTIKPNAYCST